jgi:nuclease-like protein
LSGSTSASRSGLGRPTERRWASASGLSCARRTFAFFGLRNLETADRDRYDRLLAEVRLPDGRSLNQELVRAGYAWWFRRYPADPVLARLEADARVARRGLWADPHPTPPWEYRA